MIIDAGVFIGLNNPAQREVIVALIQRLHDREATLHTTETVLAQAWRNPARQVAMTRLVKAMNLLPFGDARAIGVRCAEAGTSDVVGASLAGWSTVLDETILTTGPNDMAALNARHVTL